MWSDKHLGPSPRGGRAGHPLPPSRGPRGGLGRKQLGPSPVPPTPLPERRLLRPEGMKQPQDAFGFVGIVPEKKQWRPSPLGWTRGHITSPRVVCRGAARLSRGAGVPRATGRARVSSDRPGGCSLLEARSGQRLWTGPRPNPGRLDEHPAARLGARPGPPPGGPVLRALRDGRCRGLLWGPARAPLVHRSFRSRLRRARRRRRSGWSAPCSAASPGR